MADVLVVGGGLAGCEAAWQLAERGHEVTLLEMRPVRSTPAHQTEHLAELVCTNSFKSEDHERARPAQGRDARARLGPAPTPQTKRACRPAGAGRRP
jgi:methylenetetrahydrofolate--tRNA-(uracil-5-)-methyltransferase